MIQRILRETKTIAVVGLSKDPHKASHAVAAYLQRSGYRIIPVNPTVTGTLLGEPVYPTLLDIPDEVAVDVVDVFRGARHGPTIARQAVEIGAKVLWLQVGIVSEEAAEIAGDAGLDVVMDRCLKVEHALHGSD